MKNSSLLNVLTVVLCLCAPFVYAAFIWDKMPDRVATHFGIDGKPDAFGSKSSVMVPISFMMAVGLAIYFLFKNIEKVDPKRAQQTSKETFNKMAMLILIFMSGLSIYILNSSLNSQSGSFLFVLLGLFFAAMGNLMHSVQPNYFVGLRLPWTLDNADNWRKTHQLAGKMWFGGGLLIALSALVLSEGAAMIFMLCAVVLMCLIPTVYSYRMFKSTPQ